MRKESEKRKQDKVKIDKIQEKSAGADERREKEIGSEKGSPDLGKEKPQEKVKDDKPLSQKEEKDPSKEGTLIVFPLPDCCMIQKESELAHKKKKISKIVVKEIKDQALINDIKDAFNKRNPEVFTIPPISLKQERSQLWSVEFNEDVMLRE